jgi:hypothetical protein
MNLRDKIKALATIVSAAKRIAKAKSTMAKILIAVAAASTLAAGYYYGLPTPADEGAPAEPQIEQRGPRFRPFYDRRHPAPAEPEARSGESRDLLHIGPAALAAEKAPVPGCRFDPLNTSGVCEMGGNCPDHTRTDISAASWGIEAHADRADDANPEARYRRAGGPQRRFAIRVWLGTRVASLRESVTDGARRLFRPAAPIGATTPKAGRADRKPTPR